LVLLPVIQETVSFITLDKRYGLTILYVLLSLIAVYVVLLSDSGLIERQELKTRRKDIEAQIDLLKIEQASLFSLLKDYRSGQVTERDIIHSGKVPHDALSVYIEGLSVKKEETLSPRGRIGTNPIIYMRMLWGGITFLVLVLLVYNGYKRRLIEE
jgi:hypothetical protein